MVTVLDEMKDASNGIRSRDDESMNRLDDEEQDMQQIYLRQMNTSIVNESMLNIDDNSSVFSGLSSIPPPPPLPSMMDRIRNLASGIIPSIGNKSVRTNSGVVETSAGFYSTPNTKHQRSAWIVQQKDESLESVNASKWPSTLENTRCKSTIPHTDSDGDQRRRRHPVRRLLAFSVVLLLVLATLIAVIAHFAKQDDQVETNSFSALTGGDETARPDLPDSTTASTSFSTSAPTSAFSNLTGANGTAQSDVPDPTAAPSSLSTFAPTSTPTNQAVCEDMISVDRLCYEIEMLESSPVWVGFQVCKPFAENWIGIFPAGADAGELPNPLLWLFTCNSQDIRSCSDEGEPSGRLGMGRLLPPGSYQVHMVEFDGVAPFLALASSATYEVSAQGCT